MKVAGGRSGQAPAGDGLLTSDRRPATTASGKASAARFHRGNMQRQGEFAVECRAGREDVGRGGETSDVGDTMRPGRRDPRQGRMLDYTSFPTSQTFGDAER